MKDRHPVRDRIEQGRSPRLSVIIILYPDVFRIITGPRLYLLSTMYYLDSGWLRS